MRWGSWRSPLLHPRPDPSSPLPPWPGWSCGPGFHMTGSPSWGKHPPSLTLLPFRLQCCDLLAAPPQQGPRQEEFKHPQEKPPAIDPRVRLPEPSRAFIKEPGRRGCRAPFFLPFFCLPSHSPGLGPPPRGHSESWLVTERRGGVLLCLPPLSCRFLSRWRPGGGTAHFGPRLLSKSLEVRKVELECGVSREKPF